MLHSYEGPFPVRGLVDLGPYCSDVDYVPTVEPETDTSGLVIVGTEDRPGRRPRKSVPSPVPLK